MILCSIQRVQVKILLGDKIYGKNVSIETKGKFFKHKVGKYDSNKK